MLNVTSFVLNRPNTLPGNGQLSENFNFAAGSNICVINSLQNVMIKKIEVTTAFSAPTSLLTSDVIKYFDFRLLLTNRDGIILAGQAGTILNPTGGVFNGSVLQNSDIDVNLNSYKNGIDFESGIVAAGFIPQSFSIKYNLSSASRNLRFNINVFHTNLLC